MNNIHGKVHGMKQKTKQKCEAFIMEKENRNEPKKIVYNFISLHLEGCMPWIGSSFPFVHLKYTHTETPPFDWDNVGWRFLPNNDPILILHTQPLTTYMKQRLRYFRFWFLSTLVIYAGYASYLFAHCLAFSPMAHFSKAKISLMPKLFSLEHTHTFAYWTSPKT